MATLYIQNIKNWKIRDMVVKYLEAKATFETYNKPFSSGTIISFGTLKKICDALYEIKEDLHQIYKKIINPKKRTFEAADKFTPNEGEINFINNVGLLFHKVMVARELKYMLDYYKEDSVSYQETKASLERNLERIEFLFNQGIEILLHMVKSHTNNIYLLTYCLENQEFCINQFKLDLESLLGILIDKQGTEKAYTLAAEYYFSSGWHDKVKTMCHKILQINPQNSKAQQMLKMI